MKAQDEEESHDAHKPTRKGKAVPNPTKAKDSRVPPPFPPTANPGGSSSTIPSSSQTLVTSSGKRIRIKPPSAIPTEPAPTLLSSSQSMHRIPQFINIHNAGVPPPTHYQLSPASPMCPLGSDAEHYTVTDGDPSTAVWNSNSNNNLETPNQNS